MHCTINALSLSLTIPYIGSLAHASSGSQIATLLMSASACSLQHLSHLMQPRIPTGHFSSAVLQLTYPADSCRLQANLLSNILTEMAAEAARIWVNKLNLCPAQQLSHSKQAQIDMKDVANSKLRKELHTQSVEASEAAARLENQEKSIHTTADQLTRSRQEVRPGHPWPTQHLSRCILCIFFWHVRPHASGRIPFFC